MNAVVQDVAVSRGALWFGLLGGAIAWTVHLMFAYAAAEFGCVGRLGERGYLGITLVAWLEVALTSATALVAGAATFVAYRCDRRLRDDAIQMGAAQTNAADSNAALTNAALVAEQYTARAGLLTSGLFTFIILFESIPILYYLRNC